MLGTRDCSLQRRNQKLVEEAPAPFLSEAQRDSIHRAAHDVCARVGYVGAGTVEFLLSRTGAISFLEVNTRLQVEHPVTEETSGVDLVIEQLRVADGLPLSFTEAPATRGHALEFRINAEDVGRGFLPAPGPVNRFDAPAGPGVRVDAGVRTGGIVPGHFDSLMAKLIVWGATREQALARARRALAEFRIEGLPTVLPFHRAVLDAPDFIGTEGFRAHTRWIETDFRETLAASVRPEPRAGTHLQRVPVELDGRRVTLGLPIDLQLAGAGDHTPVGTPGVAVLPAPAPAEDRGAVLAPMTGTLLTWKVASGAEVTAGETIAVMEAMKMETQVTAPSTGRIEITAQPGGHFTSGTVLARIR